MTDSPNDSMNQWLVTQDIIQYNKLYCLNAYINKCGAYTGLLHSAFVLFLLLLSYLRSFQSWASVVVETDLGFNIIGFIFKAWPWPPIWIYILFSFLSCVIGGIIWDTITTCLSEVPGYSTECMEYEHTPLQSPSPYPLLYMNMNVIPSIIITLLTSFIKLQTRPPSSTTTAHWHICILYLSTSISISFSISVTIPHFVVVPPLFDMQDYRSNLLKIHYYWMHNHLFIFVTHLIYV